MTTPIEVVDTVPASLPEDFACRIMTPDVYAELGGDLVSGHKTPHGLLGKSTWY